ncbi:hypothetical protein HNR00_003412 [Methylorubrum rhodinum]|uniref:Uncharacterized protein n=1 Tax=Methylorubrum rhodinum TaxID=29428 RepID=A0A840ZKY6_9HYPH|nr:hypothetical protein [Methylorubrum rhodinum]MBB5758689.1 hypothetical protein [Methylorubrum rhodinum]
MGSTLKDELRRTFALATLRQQAGTLRNGRHWSQVDALMARSRTLREREGQLFAERYDSRVEAARRRLLDEAAVPERALRPRWAGHDRFDEAGLLRQARREVQAGHERRLGRIMEAEARALTEIVRQAGWQNDLQGQARDAFAREAGPASLAGPVRKSGPTRG